MEVFTVSSKSWHYRLIQLMDNEYKFDNNFCSYWRWFTFSIVQFTFAFALISGILFVVFTALIAGFWGLVKFPAIIVVFPFVWIVVDLFKNGPPWNPYKYELDDWGYEVRVEHKKNPGIFAMKYKAFKAKICPSVKIVGN